MKVLITGGAGYIGSTVASACLDHGMTPVILDNLSTGRREFTSGRIFYEGGIADGELIDQIFNDHRDIHSVVHCAAFINVPDSVSQPIDYYHNNVSNSLSLVTHALRNKCHRLIFSSSAAIYRTSDDFLVTEDEALSPTSPYARSKVACEWLLQDVATATPMNVISLRYFNPIGADPLLRTGLQLSRPSHALGRIITAMEAGLPFEITGIDYPTRDGTGLRDYVHVWDLANAHISAITRFDSVVADQNYRAINLGTGQGTTVRELVDAFNHVSDIQVESSNAPRRPGDVAGARASCELAKELLGWSTELSLEEGIRDALRWAKIRPTILG